MTESELAEIEKSCRQADLIHSECGLKLIEEIRELRAVVKDLAGALKVVAAPLTDTINTTEVERAQTEAAKNCLTRNAKLWRGCEKKRSEENGQKT